MEYDPRWSVDSGQALSEPQWCSFFLSKVAKFILKFISNHTFWYWNCKARVIEWVWHWHEDVFRSVKLIGGFRNKPVCDQMVFDTVAKTIQWRKDSPTNGSGKIWYPSVKEWIGTSTSYHVQKLTQKVDQRIHHRSWPTKPWKKCRPTYISDLWVGSSFFNYETKSTRQKVNWTKSKFKTLCVKGHC